MLCCVRNAAVSVQACVCAASHPARTISSFSDPMSLSSWGLTSWQVQGVVAATLVWLPYPAPDAWKRSREPETTDFLRSQRVLFPVRIGAFVFVAGVGWWNSACARCCLRAWDDCLTCVWVQCSAAVRPAICPCRILRGLTGLPAWTAHPRIFSPCLWHAYAMVDCLQVFRDTHCRGHCRVVYWLQRKLVPR